MASTAWYNGVDHAETSDERVPKVNRDYWRFFANLDILLYLWPIFQEFNCVQVFEKKKDITCVRAAREKHFCTRMRVLAHVHMKNGFDNAER